MCMIPGLGVLARLPRALSVRPGIGLGHRESAMRSRDYCNPRIPSARIRSGQWARRESLARVRTASKSPRRLDESRFHLLARAVFDTERQRSCYPLGQRFDPIDGCSKGPRRMQSAPSACRLRRDTATGLLDAGAAGTGDQEGLHVSGREKPADTEQEFVRGMAK